MQEKTEHMIFFQLEMKDEALRKEQLVLNQTRNARNEVPCPPCGCDASSCQVGARWTRVDVRELTAAVQAEKKVKELEKEVRVTRMVEEKAWSNASQNPALPPLGFIMLCRLFHCFATRAAFKLGH